MSSRHRPSHQFLCGSPDWLKGMMHSSQTHPQSMMTDSHLNATTICFRHRQRYKMRSILADGSSSLVFELSVNRHSFWYQQWFSSSPSAFLPSPPLSLRQTSSVLLAQMAFIQLPTLRAACSSSSPILCNRRISTASAVKMVSR